MKGPTPSHLFLIFGPSGLAVHRIWSSLPSVRNKQSPAPNHSCQSYGLSPPQRFHRQQWSKLSLGSSCRDTMVSVSQEHFDISSIPTPCTACWPKKKKNNKTKTKTKQNKTVWAQPARALCGGVQRVNAEKALRKRLTPGRGCFTFLWHSPVSKATCQCQYFWVSFLILAPSKKGTSHEKWKSLLSHALEEGTTEDAKSNNSEINKQMGLWSSPSHMSPPFQDLLVNTDG